MRKITILSIFLIIFFKHANGQQLFSYAHYIDNLVPYNNSSVLFAGSGKASMLARQQWTGVDGAPTTLFADASCPIKSLSGAAGITAIADKVGVERLSVVNAFLAKKIRLDEDVYMATSINLGFRNYVVEYSKLDVSDPVFNSGDYSRISPNVGFSISMFLSDKFFVGLSVPRITKNKKEGGIYGWNNVRNYYYLALLYKRMLSSELRWDIASVSSYVSNLPMEIEVANKLWVKDTFGFGFNFRSNKEVSLLANYRNGRFGAGYSYSTELGKPRIGGLSRATHDVRLEFLLFKSDKSIHDVYKSCPL